MAPFDLRGHVALVTGANQGIGAATARIVAACGARVLVTYLRLDSPVDPGLPDAYRTDLAKDADDVAGIRAEGGQAAALEADLADPATAARLFDTLENYTMTASLELAPFGVTPTSCTRR